MTEKTDNNELVTGDKAILNADGLPNDVADAMSKTFDRRRIITLLRDAYYFGPITIGRGGWRGVMGSGRPGTGLRRPNGPLHSCPRSWRYSILNKALSLGLIAEFGSTGEFITTERGAALLKYLAQCPECETELQPTIRTDIYHGDPNSEGHITSKKLLLACPNRHNHEEYEVESFGFQSSSSTSRTEFERDAETKENLRDLLDGHETLRAFGDGREVNVATAAEEPETDTEAIEERLDELIEDQDDPREPWKMKYPGDPERGQVSNRPVVTIGSDGALVRYVGTDDAIAVSRTETEGDIHIENVVERDGTTKVQLKMDRETAFAGAKEDIKDLHYEVSEPKWNGDATAWEITLDTLAYSIDGLLNEWEYNSETESTIATGSEWTVTVDPAVITELIEDAEMRIMGINEECELN